MQSINENLEIGKNYKGFLGFSFKNVFDNWFIVNEK